MIKILKWHNFKDIIELKNSLIENKSFIGTTDTVLGLMCKVNQDAKAALDKLKIRSEKPYVVLVDSIEKVEKLCIVTTPRIRSFLSLCWPGPVTVILSMRKDVPQWISARATVALRIPDHVGLQALSADSPWGIYSTSANISGESIPKNIDEVAQSIKDACAYYVDDEFQHEELPSTIIDCSQDDFRVVRVGAYPIERLQELYDRSSD